MGGLHAAEGKQLAKTVPPAIFLFSLDIPEFRNFSTPLLLAVHEQPGLRVVVEVAHWELLLR